jgi:hypothetical protein
MVFIAHNVRVMNDILTPNRKDETMSDTPEKIELTLTDDTATIFFPDRDLIDDLKNLPADMTHDDLTEYILDNHQDRFMICYDCGNFFPIDGHIIYGAFIDDLDPEISDDIEMSSDENICISCYQERYGDPPAELTDCM